MLHSLQFLCVAHNSIGELPNNMAFTAGVAIAIVNILSTTGQRHCAADLLCIAGIKDDARTMFGKLLSEPSRAR